MAARPAADVICSRCGKPRGDAIDQHAAAATSARAASRSAPGSVSAIALRSATTGRRVDASHTPCWRDSAGGTRRQRLLRCRLAGVQALRILPGPHQQPAPGTPATGTCRMLPATPAPCRCWACCIALLRRSPYSSKPVPQCCRGCCEETTRSHRRLFHRLDRGETPPYASASGAAFRNAGSHNGRTRGARVPSGLSSGIELSTGVAVCG